MKIRPVDSGSRALPCGRKARHEVNNRFSEFCERVYIRKHPSSSTSSNSSHSLDPPISCVLTGTVGLRLGVERDDMCNTVEVQRYYFNPPPPPSLRLFTLRPLTLLEIK